MHCGVHSKAFICPTMTVAGLSMLSGIKKTTFESKKWSKGSHWFGSGQQFSHILFYETLSSITGSFWHNSIECHNISHLDVHLPIIQMQYVESKINFLLIWNEKMCLNISPLWQWHYIATSLYICGKHHRLCCVTSLHLFMKLHLSQICKDPF